MCENTADRKFFCVRRLVSSLFFPLSKKISNLYILSSHIILIPPHVRISEICFYTSFPMEYMEIRFVTYLVTHFTRHHHLLYSYFILQSTVCILDSPLIHLVYRFAIIFLLAARSVRASVSFFANNNKVHLVYREKEKELVLLC